MCILGYLKLEYFFQQTIIPGTGGIQRCFWLLNTLSVKINKADRLKVFSLFEWPQRAAAFLTVSPNDAKMLKEEADLFIVVFCREIEIVLLLLQHLDYSSRPRKRLQHVASRYGSCRLCLWLSKLWHTRTKRLQSHWLLLHMSMLLTIRLAENNSRFNAFEAASFYSAEAARAERPELQGGEGGGRRCLLPRGCQAKASIDIL